MLTTDPSQRSDTDIQHVMIALKSVPNICDLPISILRLIVKFGFFEDFESRRVIIKQGHRPTAFYFILYGEVGVAVSEDHASSVPAKVAVKLKRGDDFGELEIISGSPRQSTVVTLGYCQFLKLWQQEYVKIFKVGGMANFNNHEIMSFLKSNELMANWPLELLRTRPDMISFAYFKQGHVIVNYLRRSQWVVLLKTGHADVVAMIPKKKSLVSQRTGRLKRESDRSAKQALNILFGLSKDEFERELYSSRFRHIQDQWSQTRTAFSALSFHSLADSGDIFVDGLEDIDIRAASLPPALRSAHDRRKSSTRHGAYSNPYNFERSRTEDSGFGMGNTSTSSRFNSAVVRTEAANEEDSDDTEPSNNHQQQQQQNGMGRKTIFNLLNNADNDGDNESEFNLSRLRKSASPMGYRGDQEEQHFVVLQQLSAGNVFVSFIFIVSFD